MPIHTVYIGADVFEADIPRRFVDQALEFFSAAFPDPETVADLLDLEPDLAAETHRRVAARLDRGTVDAVLEDLRIDFEDGYGKHTDDEDRDAERCAAAVLEAHRDGCLPRGIGLRLRSTADATVRRSLATLDRFVGGLAGRFDAWPEGFVITLAKIDHPDEITRLVDALDQRESRWGLDPGSLAIELMAETPRSVIDAAGRIAAPTWIAAARGRCVGIHLGVYDYTASLGLAGSLQHPRHPACDLARGLLQVALAGSGVELSDGSSRYMPRLDSTPERLEQSIRGTAADIRHALDGGIQRGWDITPSQTVIRWLQVTAFYLRHLPAMLAQSIHAVDDDAEMATHGAAAPLLRRGLDCGALTADDVPDLDDP